MRGGALDSIKRYFQGNADFGEKYPVMWVWCSVPKKIADADDILISVRAPIGALNFAGENYWTI